MMTKSFYDLGDNTIKWWPNWSDDTIRMFIYSGMRYGGKKISPYLLSQLIDKSYTKLASYFIASTGGNGVVYDAYRKAKESGTRMRVPTKIMHARFLRIIKEQAVDYALSGEI